MAPTESLLAFGMARSIMTSVKLGLFEAAGGPLRDPRMDPWPDQPVAQ